MNSMKRTITGDAAKALDEIERRVIIHSALDHRVDLDRRRPAAMAASMPLEDLLERAEAAAHAGEDLLVQGVQTDGDALQAVGLQIDRMLRQQHAVGGQRDVLDARECR